MWEWDGADWQQRVTAPAQGEWAYDSARRRVVVFESQQEALQVTPLEAPPGLLETWEYGPVTAADVVAYDAGCGGTAGTPVLGAVGGSLPWLGDTLRLSVGPAPVSTWALIWYGRSRTDWAGTALPLPLDALGMPGCRLVAAIDATLCALTGVDGTAAVAAAVPPSPALLGTEHVAQCGVYDPAANAAGFVTSNGCALHIGGR